MIGTGAIGAAPVSGGGGEAFVPEAGVAVAARLTRAGARGAAVVPGRCAASRVAAVGEALRPERT